MTIHELAKFAVYETAALELHVDDPPTDDQLLKFVFTIDNLARFLQDLKTELKNPQTAADLAQANGNCVVTFRGESGESFAGVAQTLMRRRLVNVAAAGSLLDRIFSQPLLTTQGIGSACDTLRLFWPEVLKALDCNDRFDASMLVMHLTSEDRRLRKVQEERTPSPVETIAHAEDRTAQQHNGDKGKPSGQADSKADNQEISVPQNTDVLELIRRINLPANQNRTKKEIARELLGNVSNLERRVNSLTRQLRRFKPLAKSMPKTDRKRTAEKSK